MFNRKGVFLTFMVFLLIGAALALNLVLRQSSVREERTAIDESAAKEVNETFNSIYSQVLEDREGYAGSVQQRILAIGSAPSGGDSFGVSQQVPPETGSGVEDAVDALNLLSIFISNPSINQNLYINAFIPDAFNAEGWGGEVENPEVGYLIQPYCVRYLPLTADDRIMAFAIPSDWEYTGGGTIWTDWDCQQPFDIDDVKSIDIDFTVGATYSGCTDYLKDVNPINCSGSIVSGSSCNSSCSDPNKPCVTINLFEEQCDRTPCKVHGTIIKSNLGITINNNKVTLLTQGGNNIVLDLLSGNTQEGKYYLMSYDGTNVCLKNTAKVNITFSGPVRVDFAGFEFAVSKPGFDLCRKTRWGTCPGEAAPTCILTELTEVTCNDTQDNDCDNKTDCADSDCDGKAGTGGTCRATEAGYCTGGFDDDGDGLTDCDDSDCSATPTCTCEDDCTLVTGLICKATCDNVKGCSITTGCNEKNTGSKFCNTASSYVTCCEGAPTPCGSGKYCSGGNCYSCSTVCDTNPCQSIACYPTDPNCTPSGGYQDCDGYY